MSHLRPVASGSPDGEPEGTGTPDLAALLRQSACADESAFATLYDVTAARVHGLALRVVRDPAQAEEVTQEVFLEVWRTAARFDPERGSAIAWLLTLTHRRAVDRVRSAEAAGRRDTTFHRQEATSLPSSAHDSTAETAQASLEAARVRAALGELTDHQQQAIRLAYYEGYTHTEVARMLDLPLGTAKTRIRDGLIRLRDHLTLGGVGS